MKDKGVKSVSCYTCCYQISIDIYNNIECHYLFPNLVSHGHRNYSGSSKRKAMKEMDTTRLKLSGYR